jgi:hypothetical protein
MAPAQHVVVVRWREKVVRSQFRIHTQPLNLVGRTHAHRGNCRLQETPSCPRGGGGEGGEGSGSTQGGDARFLQVAFHLYLACKRQERAVQQKKQAPGLEGL